MKIVVIMGGILLEREVFLNLGKEIYNNFDKNKYEVVKVIIDDKKDIFIKILEDIDFVIFVLYGKFGEDGCI